jgi:hypothetical protein
MDSKKRLEDVGKHCEELTDSHWFLYYIKSGGVFKGWGCGFEDHNEHRSSKPGLEYSFP